MVAQRYKPAAGAAALVALVARSRTGRLAFRYAAALRGDAGPRAALAAQSVTAAGCLGAGDAIAQSAAASSSCEGRRREIDIGRSLLAAAFGALKAVPTSRWHAGLAAWGIGLTVAGAGPLSRVAAQIAADQRVQGGSASGAVDRRRCCRRR